MYLPVEGSSLDDLATIEENYSWTSKRQQHNSLVRKVRFMVFDLRFNLRRLPKYKEPDGKSGNNTDFCYIVMHCGHAYAFRCRNFAAQRCRESLSWYKSCVQVGTGVYEKREKGAGPHQHSELGKAGYELFLETQHLQPDMETIKDYIETKFEYPGLCGQIVPHRPAGHELCWQPRELVPMLTS